MTTTQVPGEYQEAATGHMNLKLSQVKSLTTWTNYTKTITRNGNGLTVENAVLANGTLALPGGDLTLTSGTALSVFGDVANNTDSDARLHRLRHPA